MASDDPRDALVEAVRHVLCAYDREPGGAPTASYEGATSDACMFCMSDTWKDGGLVHDSSCPWKDMAAAYEAVLEISLSPEAPDEKVGTSDG